MPIFLRPFLRTARSRRVVVSLACGLVATHVAAQSTSGESTSTWGLGLGAMSGQGPYAGVERKNRAIPLLYFENSWFKLSGATADIKLASKTFDPATAVSFGLRLKYEDEGYEPGDSSRLSGMDERKSSLWGGFTASWRHPIAQLSAEWLADASANSKGQKATLQVEHRFGWNAFSVTPRLQAQWLDKKYVDYYFGVRANEVLPDRPAYSGQSATTFGGGIRVDYALAQKQSIFLDVSGTSLPDSIKDSPLVDRSSTSRVSLGYLYRF